MNNSSIKAATTLSLMAFLYLSGESGFDQVAHAAGPWWKCPSGQYQLETLSSQNKARCVRPGQRKRVQPDAGCPVGTVLDTDHSSQTDYCLPATGTVGPKKFSARCGSGQSVQRRNGRDRCYQQKPANYKPVSTPG